MPEGLFAELGLMRSGRTSSGRRLKGGLFPETLTITIPCEYWGEPWDTSDEENLTFYQKVTTWGEPWFISRDVDLLFRNRAWENALGGLKMLVMEVETVKDQRERMDPFIKQLTNYTFDIGGGGQLVADQRVQEIIRLEKVPYSAPPEDVEICTVSIIWRMRSASL